MSEATATKQLNNFTRVPLKLLALFPHGQAYVLGDVFSFTGKDLDCHRTYKSFKERTGGSRSTVARALRAGKAHKLIKLDNEKGYIFDLDKMPPEEFMRVLDWIIKEEFRVRKNEKRHLIKSEISAYSYIFTHCTNHKKRNKYIEISISELAGKLSLSERTVQRALWTLIRAGLIYRPKKDKGVNRYIKSRYTLNYKLIRAHEKKAKQERKTSTEEQKPQRAKTIAEIEQDYKNKRDRAELIAERNEIRARENAQFKLADDVYKSMMISAAFAYNNPQEAAEYERRAKRANADRLAILRQLGLTEADITPQYSCKLCKDTGYLENGKQCSCFPRGAPPPDGEFVGVGEQNKNI